MTKGEQLAASIRPFVASKPTAHTDEIIANHAKDIDKSIIKFAQWLCDNGWESNPPIWSNGESMSDISGRSTYDEKSTAELYKIYNQQK